MRNSLKSRVCKLEQKSTAKDVVLRFANGSTLDVTIDDPLAVLLRAWMRTSRMIGPPEGTERDETVKSLTPSKYDEMVDLVGSAEAIESDDPLLQLMHGASRRALQLETDSNERKTEAGC